MCSFRNRCSSTRHELHTANQANQNRSCLVHYTPLSLINANRSDEAPDALAQKKSSESNSILKFLSRMSDLPSLTSTIASMHILHVSGWSGSSPSESGSALRAFKILSSSSCLPGHHRIGSSSKVRHDRPRMGTRRNVYSPN